MMAKRSKLTEEDVSKLSDNQMNAKRQKAAF